MGDQKARLGNITTGSATVPEVIANRSIIIFIPGYKDLHCVAVDFELDLVADQIPDWQKITRNQGASLTPESIALIRHLRAGNKITFNEIRVKCRNCRIRTLPPFTLTIK